LIPIVNVIMLDTFMEDSIHWQKLEKARKKRIKKKSI